MLRVFGFLAGVLLFLPAVELSAQVKSADEIEEVIVLGLSSLRDRLGESGSISLLDADTVRDVAATHRRRR